VDARDDSTAAGSRRQGVVRAFDEAAGHGTVTDDKDGTERYFHCTAIADGSRTIALDLTVTFVLAPGVTGGWEAADVRPAPS
jgi:cold shock CspA family protein